LPKALRMARPAEKQQSLQHGVAAPPADGNYIHPRLALRFGRARHLFEQSCSQILTAAFFAKRLETLIFRSRASFFILAARRIATADPGERGVFKSRDNFVGRRLNHSGDGGHGFCDVARRAACCPNAVMKIFALTEFALEFIVYRLQPVARSRRSVFPRRSMLRRMISSRVAPAGMNH